MDLMVLTMAEFTRDVEQVMEKVIASGEPVVLTQGGRFVAIVSPETMGRTDA